MNDVGLEGDLWAQAEKAATSIETKWYGSSWAGPSAINSSAFPTYKHWNEAHSGNDTQTSNYRGYGSFQNLQVDVRSSSKFAWANPNRSSSLIDSYTSTPYNSYQPTAASIFSYPPPQAALLSNSTFRPTLFPLSSLKNLELSATMSLTPGLASDNTSSSSKSNALITPNDINEQREDPIEQGIYRRLNQEQDGVKPSSLQALKDGEIDVIMEG
jgi:hypothetical protein